MDVLRVFLLVNDAADGLKADTETCMLLESNRLLMDAYERIVVLILYFFVDICV